MVAPRRPGAVTCPSRRLSSRSTGTGRGVLSGRCCPVPGPAFWTPLLPAPGLDDEGCWAW